MKRITLDKPVSEMGMLELAHNSCYIKDGKARYRDYDLDVDARVLTRQLLKDLVDGDDAFTCDEDFDEWMVDYLQDGMDSTEGLIALFYRNLLAMAELRECLKTYEDTDLTPDQIKEVDRLYAEKCKEVAELKGEYSGRTSWVPSDERLPGHFESVLITVNSINGYGDRVNYVTIGTYDFSSKKWISYTGDITDKELVVAWRPLPDPPCEETAEQKKERMKNEKMSKMW